MFASLTHRISGDRVNRELKYTCQSVSNRQMREFLERRCERDGEHYSNIVSSLYFDSFDWVLAMEKASSDYLKTKVRVRWYGEKFADDNLSEGFLEVKRKIGSQRRKIRTPIPLEITRQELFCGSRKSLRWVTDALQSHAPELLPVNLMPKFEVSYRRFRFVETQTGARVAFDTNIAAVRASGAVGLERNRAALDRSVLEIKGQVQDLPEALRMPPAQGFTKAAFSKYYECFQILSGYSQ